MARRKKNVIMVCMVLMIVIIGIFIGVYMNTDMLKSNETLFAKYMGQNIWNLSSFCDKIGTDEYDNLLQGNKYTSQTEIKVNYTEDLGTSLENTKNSINQLKLKVKGETDSGNQYNYQDIKLLKNDQEISRIEYIQKENVYGIKFPNIFKQYILVNNENLKDLFKKFGYTEKQIENIPDQIEFGEKLSNIFPLTEEEKQSINTRYCNVIHTNVSKNNFIKQTNQNIQIDGKNVKANAYSLKMTKEQINNIYIKALEEMKQDEVILSRLEKIQSILETCNLNQSTTLKEQFRKEVEKSISDITKNNIGQEEVTITVYEINQTTVSTMIQTPDYEIYIDLLSSENTDYLQISYEDKKMTKKEQSVFTYKKEIGKTSIDLNYMQDGKKKGYQLESNEVVENNTRQKDMVLKYEDGTNRVEVSMEQETRLVNTLEKENVLKNENTINLSELNKEEIELVSNKVKTGITEKVNQITTTQIKIEDLWAVLKATGLIKEEQILQNRGVSEAERNRFNSQFEILQGNDLDSESILKLIDAIRENLINMEVISNTELKLKLDRFDKNQELATRLSTFIEQNKDKQYNVKVEYEQETGLVSSIVLTIVGLE